MRLLPKLILGSILLVNFSFSPSSSGISNNPILKKANQFFVQSKFDSASVYFHHALVDFEKNNVYPGVSTCLNLLGELQNIKGNNNLALEYLERNRTSILNHSGNQNELLAECDDLIGAVYHDMDDIEEALIYFKESLSIKLNLYGENDARTAFSYQNLASYFNFKMQFDSAFYYSERAMNICQRYPEHNNEIKLELIYSEYAYDYKIYKRISTDNWNQVYDTVRMIYNQALLLVRSKYASPNYFEASILHSIGNTYTDLVLKNRTNKIKIHQYFIQAKNFYEQDLEIKIKLFGGHHPSVSTTYYTLGLLYSYSFEKDGKQTALEYFQHGILALLPKFKNEDILSIPNLDSCPNLYDLNVLITATIEPLTILYKETNDIKYLKAIHEHNKLRIIMWDKIMSSFKSAEVSQVIHLWNHAPFEESAQSAFQLYHLTSDSTYLKEIFIYSEKSKNSELMKSLLQSSKATFKNDTSNLNENKLKTTDVISIQEIQKSVVDNETAFIEYFTMPDVIFETNFIFLIEQHKFKVIEIRNSTHVDSLIVQMKKAMENNSAIDFNRNSFELYSLILNPAIENLDVSIRKLIIVPHGLYSLIPFDALLTDSSNGKVKDFRRLSYLINKYETSYALSASLLSYITSIPSTKNQTVSGFAPQFSNLSSLPFSSNLLNNISGKLDGNYYFNENAKSSSFIQSAPNNSVIHLATHAIADVEHPENSKIFFTPDSLSKDYLSLDEIYSMKLNSNLAVLSACETSIGKELYSEGMKSFARAFTYAGCKSTVTTLWKVDDKATSTILKKFYERLLSGQPKNDALHEAKLNYLKNCKTSDEANPLFWAGIILTGDESALELKTKRNYHTELLISFGFLLVGIVIWRKVKAQSS